MFPATLCLALFAWLLTLHSTTAGRVYATYGGVCIFVAILWLWAVDDILPTTCSGARQHELIAGIVGGLSDRNMQDAAAYFSRQVRITNPELPNARQN